MRVATYIRTARDDDGQSADRQRTVLARHLTGRGWRPDGEYTDLGQPGTTLNRL